MKNIEDMHIDGDQSRKPKPDFLLNAVLKSRREKLNEFLKLFCDTFFQLEFIFHVTKMLALQENVKQVQTFTETKEFLSKHTKLMSSIENSLVFLPGSMWQCCFAYIPASYV